VCLGDIVGYGASPTQCIDLAAQTLHACVAGNHDWGAIAKTDPAKFNQAARLAIEWTASHLSESGKQFLSSLPLSLQESDFIATHATPVNPAQWHYVFTISDAARNIEAAGHRLCFVGHSHIPGFFCMNRAGVVSYTSSMQRIPLLEANRYLINVGSVGQPRDNDPRAAYGVLDLEKAELSIRRVTYDITAAQRKILAAGLPEVLAERLAFGW